MNEDIFGRPPLSDEVFNPGSPAFVPEITIVIGKHPSSSKVLDKQRNPIKGITSANLVWDVDMDCYKLQLEILAPGIEMSDV